MRDLVPTPLPDDQLSQALARVHGRLRRRRYAVRGAGAGAAAMACIVLLGVSVSQGDHAEAPLGTDAMDAEGAPPAVAPNESEVCGRALGDAAALGLDLSIRGPVAWPAAPMTGADPPRVIVIARNQSHRPLTISLPAGVVGISDESTVATEAPVPSPPRTGTTVTLEPSESTELPAGLPQQTCAGEPLGRGDYMLVPIVQVEGLRHSPVNVRGSALSVSHR